jgi:8-oxo-dGTP pyrophosphatase MutT (NUDIX family)
MRDRFPVVVHVLMSRRSRREGDAAAAGLGDELFLLRRAGTGFMDGFHVPPGGHLVAGESVAEAALRECREETGVTPGRLVPLCVLPYRSGRHQGFNFVFAGEALSGPPSLAEPDASDAAGWYPLDRLPEPLAPWLPDALSLIRAGGWYRELYWP